MNQQQIQPKIGKREDAKKRYGVGGKAFPGDYNWLCPVCDADCRAFERECYSCKIDALNRGAQ